MKSWLLLQALGEALAVSCPLQIWRCHIPWLMAPFFRASTAAESFSEKVSGALFQLPLPTEDSLSASSPGSWLSTLESHGTQEFAYDSVFTGSRDGLWISIFGGATLLHCVTVL